MIYQSNSGADPRAAPCIFAGIGYRLNMGSPNMEPAASPDLSPDIESSASSTSSARGGRARMQSLSAAERRALGRKAAKARWGEKAPARSEPGPVAAKSKTKKAKKRPAQKPRREAHPPGRQVPHPLGRQVPAKGVFGVALMAAEERLACAIEERARAAAQWAVLQAEIPSLQRTIAALRNQQNAGSVENYPVRLPDGSISAGAPNASPADYSLAAVVSDGPAQVPPSRPASSLAGGGAIDVNLGGQEDEDMFLRDSPVGRGEWR